MVFEKVIKTVEIQREYKTFVEKYMASLLAEFSGKIHSIYMCGSIPKGTAKPFKSDADFTIVCENPADISYKNVTSLKENILEEFPLVTKIDTIICSIDEVKNRPNEWGFWIKIICVCVYGKDIGEELAPIHISRDFILDLNKDTEEEVNRVRNALFNASDDSMKYRYMKGYSKRLLRALYSLVLEDVGIWQDDISEMKKSILKFGDIDSALVEYLYSCYLDTNVEVEEFLEVAEQVYKHFECALSELATSRNSIG